MQKIYQFSLGWLLLITSCEEQQYSPADEGGADSPRRGDFKPEVEHRANGTPEIRIPPVPETDAGELEQRIRDKTQQNGLDSIEDLLRDLRDLAKVDPVRAFDIADELPLGAKRMRALKAVVEQWPPSDTMALVRRIAGSEIKEDSQLLFTALQVDRARLSIGDAKVLLDELADSESRELVAVYYASLLVRNGGLSAAVKQVRASPFDDATMVSVVNKAVRVAALSDASGALNFVDVQPDASISQETMSYIGESLGRQNPSKDASFLYNYCAEHKCEAMLRSFVGSWLIVDSYSASEWVAGLPQGELRSIAALRVQHYLRGKGMIDQAEWWKDFAE